MEASGAREVSDLKYMQDIEQLDDSYMQGTGYDALGTKKVKNQLTLQLKNPPPMSPVIDQEDKQSGAPNFGESMRSSLWPKESHI